MFFYLLRSCFDFIADNCLDSVVPSALIAGVGLSIPTLRRGLTALLLSAGLIRCRASGTLGY